MLTSAASATATRAFFSYKISVMFRSTKPNGIIVNFLRFSNNMIAFLSSGRIVTVVKKVPKRSEKRYDDNKWHKVSAALRQQATYTRDSRLPSITADNRKEEAGFQRHFAHAHHYHH